MTSFDKTLNKILNHCKEIPPEKTEKILLEMEETAPSFLVRQYHETRMEKGEFSASVSDMIRKSYGDSAPKTDLEKLSLAVRVGWSLPPPLHLYFRYNLLKENLFNFENYGPCILAIAFCFEEEASLLLQTVWRVSAMKQSIEGKEPPYSSLDEGEEGEGGEGARS